MIRFIKGPTFWDAKPKQKEKLKWLTKHSLTSVYHQRNRTKQDRLKQWKKKVSTSEICHIDKASGKDFNRPKYQLLKQLVRKDDTIVFDSITRMGRNMDETLKEYEWFNENGVLLRFIKEPMINTNNEKDDVMKEAIQKIILTLLTHLLKRNVRKSK